VEGNKLLQGNDSNGDSPHRRGGVTPPAALNGREDWTRPLTAVLWQYICHLRAYPLRDYHEAFVEWIMDYYARC